MRALNTSAERWPIAGGFVIARGAKHEAEVIVTTISDGTHRGRSECVPYARYGETVQGVQADIMKQQGAVANGTSRVNIASQMNPGAALNAVDCALWDLEAKALGHTVADLIECPLTPVTTAFTISLGPADAMAAAAAKADKFPLLKLKLGGEGDETRLRSVRAARPDARLIVDANEAWTDDLLEPLLATAADVAIEVVEQPLPSDADGLLASVPHPVPICADESAHSADQIVDLTGRYDAVNIKLDKAGGLTGGLTMADAAKKAGLKIMVGCMVGTSLAMAPACFIAQQADWVDLDGPLLLARDRDPALRYDGATLYPPDRALWG